MIELYSLGTPNGYKIALFLAEAELAYNFHRIDISKGEQFAPDFLKISPNNKIPAIVDTEPKDGGEPLAVFESGAILIYLAEKTGKFLSTDFRTRFETLQWLFWQVGGLGPMAGQNGHFNVYAPEKIPYAMERYTKETNRLYGVLDKQLSDREFIAGEYSIADIASYPWIVPHKQHKQDLGEFPNLARWYDTITARPATQKVYAGAAPSYSKPMSDEERKVLFGQTAR